MCQPFVDSDYYHRSATSLSLQLQLTQSLQTDNDASYVHNVVRDAFDRRLPLYARRTQT
jgi:hypothetical protein